MFYIKNYIFIRSILYVKTYFTQNKIKSSRHQFATKAHNFENSRMFSQYVDLCKLVTRFLRHNPTEWKNVVAAILDTFFYTLCSLSPFDLIFYFPLRIWVYWERKVSNKCNTKLRILRLTYISETYRVSELKLYKNVCNHKLLFETTSVA